MTTARLPTAFDDKVVELAKRSKNLRTVRGIVAIGLDVVPKKVPLTVNEPAVLVGDGETRLRKPLESDHQVEQERALHERFRFNYV